LLTSTKFQTLKKSKNTKRRITLAVIHFTASDALQTTVVPANIYPSEISSITGPTKSSTAKSFNYFVDVMISEGQFKGKIRTIIFNSESNNISMMGDMQFFPQSYFLMVDAAINGRDIKPEDYAFDTDTLLHKPFDANWGVITVDGHLTNVINSFHPKGYATQGPSF
jgi:hypothetical protein